MNLEVDLPMWADVETPRSGQLSKGAHEVRSHLCPEAERFINTLLRQK